ncbi:hypothetical protein Tco_0033490 [Tanacetum coccineum]
MDLYHSRLTQDDLNDLIIKYKILCDLHPWLPSEEFVMSELPDDAIGIYHRMFDFSGVRIPFSSLPSSPHQTIHGGQGTTSHIGTCWSYKSLPSKVLFRSLQIEPTVNLFRVFQTLFKQVWKSRICDSVLRGADGNVLGIHDFLCLPEWTGAEVQEEPHLDVRLTLQRLPFYCTPPAATDAVIPKPALEDLAIGDSDDESDGDDDTCVEIPLVTPLRSAAVIHPSGNQGRSSAAPAAEGSNTRDSRSPSFRDVSGGAIHTDFFPFSTCPYYATYPEDGVAGNYEFTREDFPLQERWSVLRVYLIYLDSKMIELHCMIMSHGVSLLAPIHALTVLELQVSTLKKKVSGLNDKLATSDASFSKSKAKGKERKKRLSEEILRLKLLPPEFLPSSGAQFYRVSSGICIGLRIDIVVELKNMLIHRLCTGRLVEAIIPLILRCHSSIAKESTVTPVSKSLELSVNVVPAPLLLLRSGMRISCAVESERISSGPTNVVVALFVDGKGDVLIPSSVAGEEAVINSSGV